ncbi:MAG TPA: AbrB/MazE/SpoVT family DNA-binding domain-containing protein [Terriglobia bacterium]|nr:AbrB/MazE/SpoVT family DNA-binding domain-containing protein [Terriglobia bacterium]
MAFKGTYAMRLGAQGRLVLPAPVRKAMGLHTGDTLLCIREGNRIVLRQRRAVEEDLWERFGKVKKSLARELIADRRREAKLEAGR